ncbi:MAG: MATE family efflux transporter [Streptococcaceae bacterium]|nr:MATE family efflux transporter [Streptococcaceae bacterium]
MKDLTKGSILKGILLFATPLLFGNFFQMLYTTVDAIIVGKTLGAVAVGAIGATASVSGIIISTGQGVTAGMALFIAKYFGAKKTDKVRESFSIGLTFSIGLSLLLTVVAMIFINPLLRLMQMPESIFAMSREFLMTIFLGMIFSSLYNYLSATLRALGNSRVSMIALLVSNVFNAGLSALLVIHFRMGVLGAGLATIGAQAISVVFLILYIKKRVPLLQFRLFAFDKKEVQGHLRLGIPMGFQASVITLGSLIQQIAVNKMGTLVIVAQTIGLKYDGFAGMVMGSLGIAMATFTAQNYGAKEFGRIIKGLKQTLLLAVSYGVIFAAILWTLNRAFTGLFMNAQSDPKIYGITMLYYLSTGSLYWLLGILLVTRYMLQGIGQAKAPTLAGIMELVLRVIFAIIGVILKNPLIIFISESVAWVGSTAVLIPASRRVIKNFKLQSLSQNK